MHRRTAQNEGGIDLTKMHSCFVGHILVSIAQVKQVVACLCNGNSNNLYITSLDLQDI